MADACGTRHQSARRAPRALSRPLLVATLAVGLSACGDARRNDAPATSAAGMPAGLPAVRPAITAPAQLALGRPATAAMIGAIDIDANPAGVGLPAGRGTYREGAALYAASCAACHGARGEGMGPYPTLIGAPADSSFRFGTDLALVKTVGNYWPYATTLYDYIHRAMPLNAPGSLRPPEVYSLVAYLLAENRIISRDAVIDARALPAIRMPARKHFERDDRRGGPGFR